MDSYLKFKWVEALRSGQYTQTTGELHRINAIEAEDGDYDSPAGFCCLGVLCDVSKMGEWHVLANSDCEFVGLEEPFDGDLSTEMLDRINLSARDQTILIHMNDNKRNTFAEIADYIEREL